MGGSVQDGSGGTNGGAGGSTATASKTGGNVGTGGSSKPDGSVGTGGVSSTGGVSTTGITTSGPGGGAGSGGGTSSGGTMGTGGSTRNDAAPSIPGTGGSTTRDGGADSAADAPALQDTNAADSPASDAGVAGDSLYAIGCPAAITNPVPADVLKKLPGSGPQFTGKYIDCYGLPIMNAKEVSDLAVLRDRDCVEAMLRKIAREPALNSILTTMIKNGCGAALTPVKGDICTIWTDTACGGTVRGGGGIISVVGEEDALCQAQPQWDTDFCVIVHEFTHTLHMNGIQPARPDLEKRIVAAFNAARADGKVFDAVITDLGMPNMNGRKVAATVKQAASSNNRYFSST